MNHAATNPPPAPPQAPAPPLPQPADGVEDAESVAGEEDPGAALDSGAA